MKRGAIILAGGQSRRMGTPKADLPFGPETLLTRLIRILSPLVSDCVVVAAAGQSPASLPAKVQLVHDERPARGPLEGLRAGLSASASCDACYVSSCDAPLLQSSFVTTLFDLLRPDDQIVVPRDTSHFHPLAAVYRHSVLPHVEELLRQDRLRPFFLFERVVTRAVDVEDLRVVDPTLQSLRNLNSPADYHQALAQLGLQHEGM